MRVSVRWFPIAVVLGLVAVAATPARAEGGTPPTAVAQSAPADPAAPAGPAAPADPAVLAARLKQWDKSAGKTRPLPAAYLEVAAQLARLHTQRGELPAARAAWARLDAAWQRGGFAPAGPEATLAGEARWALLQPDLDRADAQLPRLAAGGAAVVQIAELETQTLAWLDLTAGPLRTSKKDAPGMRAGGLIAQANAVAELAPATLAGPARLQAGQLALAGDEALATLPAPATWTEAERGALATTVARLRATTRPLAEQGLATLEQTYKAAEQAGTRAPWVVELRKALHRRLPTQYPLLQESPALDPNAVTEAQKEASRLAGLALKTDRPGLRVMYLRKAVQLDPANERFRELLAAAEAEQGAGAP